MTGPAQHSLMVGRDESTRQPRVAEFTDSRLKVDIGSIWTIQFVSDTTLNDNNKAIPVPANRVWHILAIRVEYASDANAGNRQLSVRFRDGGDDVMWEVRPNIVQAASLTYLYNFGSSMSDLDAVRDADWVSTPIPPTLILPAGSDIQVYDNNDISAGDDIVIHLTIGSRDA